MAKWNTHIIIFGWCENFLMGISSVNNLFFNGRMKTYALFTQTGLAQAICLFFWIART